MSPLSSQPAFAASTGFRFNPSGQSISARSVTARPVWGCTPVSRRVQAPVHAFNTIVTATTEPVEVTADTFDAEVLEAVGPGLPALLHLVSREF